MDKTEQIRFELKESLLWQALNAQLLDLKDQGIAIKDSDHEYLQKVCFDNNLFSTVTEPIIYEEIPFSLMTDFNSVCFVSIKFSPWNKAINDILPGTLSLSIDQARADAFESLSGYDRNFQFFPEAEKQEVDSDDDTELYAFIGECEDLRAESGYDFAELVFKAYDAKANFLSDVVEKDSPLKTMTQDNNIILDLADSNNKDEIISIYRNTFIEATLAFMSQVVSPVASLKSWNLYGLLNTTFDDAGTKQSIKDFCEHELRALSQEHELIRQFHSDLSQFPQGKNINAINLCNISPFHFLSSPFPTV
jgi:hypothetical protein